MSMYDQPPWVVDEIRERRRDRILAGIAVFAAFLLLILVSAIPQLVIPAGLILAAILLLVD
jgi:hypothetical protein